MPLIFSYKSEKSLYGTGTPSSEHEFFGAGFFPQAGYVSDPMLAASNMMSAAKATGKAEHRYNTAVTSIDVSGGRVSGVTLQGGESVAAPIVLNAGGPHSAQLTDMAFAGSGGIQNDMNVKTRAMRTEVAYVSSMPEWDYQQGPTFADFDVGVYWRPQVGGQILIGSIEPECDNGFHVHPSDADQLDTGFSEQMTNQIYRELPPHCSPHCPTVLLLPPTMNRQSSSRAHGSAATRCRRGATDADLADPFRSRDSRNCGDVSAHHSISRLSTDLFLYCFGS